MKTILKPGPLEIEQLRRIGKFLKRFMYVFIAFTVLFFVAMALPFEGFNAWFWITLVFGGVMFLLSQGIRIFMEQKINRYATKGRMAFYEGIVTEYRGIWGWSRGGKGTIHLDGEKVDIDLYDYGRLKTGDSFAYLVWDELEHKIDSAIGGEAIAALKVKRNLP